MGFFVLSTAFGRVRLSDADRLKIGEDLKQMASESLPEIKKVVFCEKNNDAFCDSAVIAKQSVINESEKSEIHVLYNYAPLGKDKLHFLITPKCHREKFTDLTQSEYKKVEETSKKLIQFYQEKVCEVVHMFDKTGKRAGQTVPHWHRHIVFTEANGQNFWGKMQVLRNMIFGSSPLSKEELKRRVAERKKELENVF